MKAIELLNRIEKRNYECVASFIKNDADFIALKKIFETDKSYCCMGKDHPCPLNVNNGYCCAIECQFCVIDKNEEIV